MSSREVLVIGFSPCPNDTFIFGALAQGLIPLRKRYRLVIEDVEALNQRAFKDPLPLSKLSLAAFAHLLDTYQLLPVGAALGCGEGPVLVAKEEIDLSRARVAIPGRLTTAAFLLRLYSPVKEMVEYRYDQILPALKAGLVEAGVLIHEGRFVYQREGLFLLKDLGLFWEELTKAPLPLGGLFVRRDLPSQLKNDLLEDVRKSLHYARENLSQLWPFIKAHAQEMEDEIIHRHLRAFVNRFTYDLGEEGQRAVKLFLELAAKKGLIKEFRKDFLWEEGP